MNDVMAIADDEWSSEFHGGRTISGQEVDLRPEEENPALFAIRGILLSAHHRYFETLENCCQNPCAPEMLGDDMEWLGERPVCLRPVEANLLYLYAHADKDQFNLSSDLSAALRQIFDDTSVLSGGDVRLTETAFDILCQTSGLDEELSLDPGRWPSNEHTPGSDLYCP